MLPQPKSPLRFTVVREINADVARAFEALTSIKGMQAWIPQCRQVRWIHPKARRQIGVDSVRHILLPGGIVAAERIVAWEAGHELHYCFDPESTFPVNALTRNYVGTTRIEALSAKRSRLTWSAHFDAPGPLALLVPLVRASLWPLISVMAWRLARHAEAS